MATIDRNHAAELETKKAELLEKLSIFTDGIIAERDGLARKIFETQKAIAKIEQGIAGAPIEEDIFNAEAILAGGAGETAEEQKMKLRLFARAYATNPFCDKKKAQTALEILDELEQITKALDNYYNEEVAKTAVALEKAKKAHKEAKAAKLNYQRETNHGVQSIKRASDHSIIGENELRKMGVYLDGFSGLMLAGVGYPGSEMVSGAKAAINFKRSKAEELRKMEGETGARITVFTPAEYIPGEPAAYMGSTNDSSGVFKGLVNIFKK